MEKNIVTHNFSLEKSNRNKLKGHKSFCLWFTGLSGSGKSTIANRVEELLLKKGLHTYILDGDNVRSGLNSDLSFSPQDRKENIRRISHVTNLMIDAGLIVLSTFVSPYREDRNSVNNLLGDENFLEVYINTSLEECISRDTKGLYKKAKNGEIPNLSGFNAPYEAPLNSDIEIKTEERSIDECALLVIEMIQQKIKL